MIETRGNRGLFNQEGTHVGVQQMESTLHYGPSVGLNGYSYANFKFNREEGFNDDFHIFRLGWTPTTMQFSVDNTIVGSINATSDGGFWNRGRFDERDPGRDNPWKRNSIMAPFDQEFFIILNVAVGSRIYFGDDLINESGEKPWKNYAPYPMTDFWDGREQWLPTWELETDSSHMQVDYVRVYAV